MATGKAKIRIVGPVSLTVPTGALADKDSMAEFVLEEDFLTKSGLAIIHWVKVEDPDNQKGAFDIVVSKTDFDLAAAGIGNIIDFADAQDANILEQVNIVATDYNDNANSANAWRRGYNGFLNSDGLTDLYVGAISRGTKTYAGAVVRVYFGLFDMN